MDMSDRLSIAFQGTKSGLVIAIDDTLPFDTMIASLSEKLDESGDFFANAGVTLNLGARALTEVDLKKMMKVVQNAHDLRIVGLKSDSPETVATAELVGISRISAASAHPGSAIPAQQNGRQTQQSIAVIESLPAAIIRKTLRSGQMYESRQAVVILGDVNAGAEVISAGDIVVFGALRGIAHAGAGGNENCIIAALKLEPMQLRIASRIARAEDKPGKSRGPEFASIEKDQIVIDKWSSTSYRLLSE